MEEALIILLIVVLCLVGVGVSVILPIVATVIAVRARRHARKLYDWLSGFHAEFDKLRKRVDELARRAEAGLPAAAEPPPLAVREARAAREAALEIGGPEAAAAGAAGAGAGAMPAAAGAAAGEAGAAAGAGAARAAAGAGFAAGAGAAGAAAGEAGAAAGAGAAGAAAGAGFAGGAGAAGAAAGAGFAGGAGAAGAAAGAGFAAGAGAAGAAAGAGFAGGTGAAGAAAAGARAAAAGAAAAPPSAPQSLEEKIGVIWFTRIGALIGVVVAGWFFKYMVDNEWIGPWGRVAIGALVGLGLLAWGEYLHRRKKHTHPYFVQGVLGLGLAVLFVTTYASFAFYHIAPVLAAFSVVAVLCLLGGALAIVHRSEPILILSLVAVFLNPIMLSTGQDKALQLFAYLLVMTSASMAVSVKYHFRFATWTAVAGVLVLFAGWYAKFFDPSPPPEPGVYDDLPEKLQGAYFPMAARWVPLLFAAIFAGQWALFGLGMRRKGHRITALGLYLAAAVAAHAAYASLLFDHPIVLGGVLCALAIGFSVLLVREDAGDWLGLPMVASFVVLAALTGEFGKERLLPMMVLTGGLSAIYFGVFFRNALKRGTLSSARSHLLLGGAGLGLAILSALYLMPDHFEAFAGLLTGLAFVFMLVAVTARSAAVMLGAFIATLLGLGSASFQCQETQVGFLAVCGLWFLLYVGFLAWDLFVRDNPWSGGRLAVLSGAGLAFGALFLMATPESATTLRALLAVGTGAVYLIFGARMLKAGRYAQDRSLLPLGLAVTFFTLAVAFLLTGPGITVTWAVEAAVLAYLATRARRDDSPGHPAWLLGAWTVFGACAFRILAFDWHWLHDQYFLAIQSLGAEGQLVPTAFAHPRAWALLALAAALLFGARGCARVRAKSAFRVSALIMAILGHLAALILLVSEARILFTDWPDPIAPGLPGDEFRAMLSAFDASVATQATRLQMVTTLVIGLYAAALLAIGFAAKDRLHRFLGIGLFGITLLKLGLMDIWALETLHKIIVGAAIAALLLAGGFLYARFSDRIKKMLMEENGKGLVWLLLLCGLAALAPPARAEEARDDRPLPARYEKQASIQGVSAAGDYFLELPPGVYSASRVELRDLRVLGPGDEEMASFRRRAWRESAGKTIAARVLDPVILPDGGSQATLDLGTAPVEHARVELSISGHDYLRSTRVESSPDGKAFGLLAAGAYVFDVSAGGPRARRSWIRYPGSRARFLRVTLLPGSDAEQLRIHSAHALPPSPPEASIGQRSLPIAFAEPPAHKDKRTIVPLERLPAGVPFDALEIEIGQGEYVRRVRVEASTRKQAWFHAGGGVIYRVQRQVANPDAQPSVDECLELPVSPGERPFLRLVVDDGDDPPLDIHAVRARYLAEEIVFRARKAGSHRLLVGREKDPGARYDLEAQLRRAGPKELSPASLAALEPNPAFAAFVKPEGPEPWTERHSLVIQIGVGIIALALLIWTVMLLRKGSGQSGGDGS
ncbi:MAG: DUF2339 domain-containing protein [Deltaproteobacteria bacterium]|nr:DUF2339 domain-containing protein [Deltaproteobacteria bacterium]